MQLFNICFYRPEYGDRLYHCLIIPVGAEDAMVVFDAKSKEKLETMLRYFGVDTRLREAWFLAKHFWLYDIPLFPERPF